MSILIKGMEMPKDENVFILIATDGSVWRMNRLDKPDKDELIGKASELPPHGDLIDRDKYEVFSYTGTEGRPDTFDDGVMFMLDRLSDAPTIIEAEGETE